MSARGALFAADGLTARELGEGDLGELQELFDACPAYFETVMGERAAPTAAREELDSRPPDGWSWTRRWLIGFRDARSELTAMALVVSDLPALAVWHIGLFMVPERLHGTGIAQRAYGALEAWIRSNGARWLRLGVVEGNTRAERFWRSRGYAEVRKRTGLAMGRRTNTVRVMAKPLAGGTIADYLALAARDRPEGD